MTTVAEVRLWGRTIGAVSIDDRSPYASFEYASDFVDSGIQVAPLTMPLSDQVFRFPELPRKTFYGLPGLLADSLPDRFGTALIEAWLATQGRHPSDFNSVERLCYTGRRGMGALEFHPITGPRARPSHRVEVDALVSLASEVLSQRDRLVTSFADREKEDALKAILRVGTSAGGARAKAAIAWNRKTGEVRSGQVDPSTGSGFEYWLIKLDGVSGNRDKELEDPKGYGRIEYAYYKMATAAGIRMNPSELLEESGRQHFITKRFDRLDVGDKLHMQTLCALAHYDFNQSGTNSYEQTFLILRSLDMDMETIEELFRRMAFNILARNQDDHVKNIAFLMDKTGRWSLSPAYDVTYSYNPDGAWTSTHQMSMNGKRDDFTLDDFKACAGVASMKRGRDQAILDEVRQAIGRWPEFAAAGGVDEAVRRKIGRAFRYRRLPTTG